MTQTGKPFKLTKQIFYWTNIQVSHNFSHVHPIILITCINKCIDIKYNYFLLFLFNTFSFLFSRFCLKWDICIQHVSNNRKVMNSSLVCTDKVYHLKLKTLFVSFYCSLVVALLVAQWLECWCASLRALVILLRVSY